VALATSSQRGQLAKVRLPDDLDRKTGGNQVLRLPVLRALVVTGQPPNVGIAHDEQRRLLRHTRGDLTAQRGGEVGGFAPGDVHGSGEDENLAEQRAVGLPPRSILPPLAPPIGWVSLAAIASRSRPLSRIAASMICPAAFASSSALWCWNV
jgi:hypothetical protein